MDNTKSKFESLTIQGSLVGALPAVYAVLMALGMELPDGSLEAVAQGVMAILAISSVVMTYIGRMRAKHQLS